MASCLALNNPLAGSEGNVYSGKSMAGSFDETCVHRYNYMSPTEAGYYCVAGYDLPGSTIEVLSAPAADFNDRDACAVACSVDAL
mmetsp:Transcript_31699/g.94499  ORF Transcript_31699/g.94499 Transcript_31699/m.94499 type:complete len:85 (+) Transcript_31699:3857-4111(+)